MSLRRDYEDELHSFNEVPYEEKVGDLDHKKKVRRMLEDRLEKKRLREEIDELDGDFDWEEIDK